MAGAQHRGPSGGRNDATGGAGPRRTLLAVAQTVSPLVVRTLTSNREAALRFRDVVQPYLDVTGYLLHRSTDEQTPDWRDLFRFDAADR